MSEILIDDLLSAWRTQHQLNPSKVEAIRTAILASPDTAALSDAWWDRYTKYLYHVLDEAQRATKCVTRRKPWQGLKAVPFVNTNTSDWQPYMKLA
jgi:hypothetical protein